MSENRILATNRHIQVETCTQADEELMLHLNSVILGTPGRTRYKLTNIENKLAHMKETYFVLLRMKGHLLGSIGFNKKVTSFGENDYNSWYIRYFYIHAPFRSKRQKKEKYRDPSKGSNMIREAGLDYMKEPSLLIPETYDPKAKDLVYGYVESLNFRSLNMSEQADYVTIRKFNTLIFTRFSLKADENVRRLEKNKIEEFRPKLKEFYKDFSLFSDENMFYDGNYFGYFENGEIVAGVQVHRESWKVVEIPGNTNRLLLKILPVLPVVRNFFNPKDFRFLALEGFYYLPGKEHLIEKLIESVCKHFKTHFALMWIDVESRQMEDIKKHVDFGTIGKSFEKIEADVRVRFNNFEEEEKQKFFENPCYISAFDSV